MTTVIWRTTANTRLRRKRPLAAGTVNKGTALSISILLFLSAVLIGYFL
jgi:4-hydroxybenzoate polyprenyltransferase